jgi:hypothetical protein
MEFYFENSTESYKFPCGTKFYCTIQLINKIICKQFIYFQGKCSCYVYLKNLLKLWAVFRSCKFFLLRAKLEGTFDMFYRYGQIVVKQIVKRLIVVIILNLRFSIKHCLIKIETIHFFLNTEARSCSHYWSGKTINTTHYESVYVALCTQHGMYIRRVILSSVACPAIQYFSTLTH